MNGNRFEQRYISDRAKAVSPSGIRVIFERAQKIKDIVRLEIGEPDFDTPDHIKEAAREALDQNYTHYSSEKGFLELRDAISDKLRRDNDLDFNPETEIVVTSGACSALNLSILATVNPGDEVLVPDPGWPPYASFVTLAGGKVVRYPLYERNEFRIDPASVENRTTSKTKMIIVNSPSNPTGAVLKKKDLEAIAEIANEHGLLVLSDEVYEKIVYDDARHHSIGSFSGMKDQVISVNAFSKTYAMTGWRLGYVASKEEIIRQIAKLNSFNVTCANTVAQRAGIAALNGPQDLVSKMVAEYERRRDFFAKQLNQIAGASCLIPKGTFYIFANMSTYGLSSFDLSMLLLDKSHVSSVPGSSFGELGEGYVRFSYANSLEALKEGISRIERAVNNLRK